MATQCFSPRLIRLKPFWLFLHLDCYTINITTAPSADTAQNHPLDHRLKIIPLSPRCVCLSTQFSISYRFFIVVASAYTFTLASYLTVIDADHWSTFLIFVSVDIPCLLHLASPASPPAALLPPYTLFASCIIIASSALLCSSYLCRTVGPNSHVFAFLHRDHEHGQHLQYELPIEPRHRIHLLEQEDFRLGAKPL